MRLLNYISIISFLFTLTTCNSQNNKVELALKECVNQKVNENIKAAYGKEPFDFYEFILKIEEKLLSNNLIEKVDKENYFILLNKLINSNDPKSLNMYKEQNTIIDKFGFGFNSFVINEGIFNQCPYAVSLSNKETDGKLIYEEGKVLNKLMAQGFDDKALLKELFNTLDEESFKKEVYRAPIILLVMINIDTKYNPNLQRLKERQKGKKFLNKN